MFVAMGLSAIFPVLHGLEIYGFHEMRQRIGLTWMLLQGFLYILGAGLYAVSNVRSGGLTPADKVGSMARALSTGIF